MVGELAGHACDRRVRMKSAGATPVARHCLACLERNPPACRPCPDAQPDAAWADSASGTWHSPMAIFPASHQRIRWLCAGGWERKNWRVFGGPPMHAIWAVGDWACSRRPKNRHLFYYPNWRPLVTKGGGLIIWSFDMCVATLFVWWILYSEPFVEKNKINKNPEHRQQNPRFKWISKRFHTTRLSEYNGIVIVSISLSSTVTWWWFTIVTKTQILTPYWNQVLKWTPLITDFGPPFYYGGGQQTFFGTLYQ